MRDITLGKIISILSFFTLAQICHSMPPEPEEVFSQEDFQKSAFEKVHILRELLLSKSFTVPDECGSGSSNIQRTEDEKKIPSERNEEYWKEQCERGVKRILDIRGARLELINFEVENEKAWERFYASLQPLKGNLDEEDVLFRWPTQDSFEHACKAHLLLRAVLGDEQLLSYLEYTVFNSYQNAALIKTVFENLFWENPRLLERGHLETLRVAGDNKRGKDGSQYETVYGNSMAHWLYFSGTLDQDEAKRTLRTKVMILKINIGATSCTGIKPTDAEKNWERFKFLKDPDFVSEQKALWESKEKVVIERELEKGNLHAGVAKGWSVISSVQSFKMADEEVIFEAINNFAKEGQNGNPNGWFFAELNCCKFANAHRRTSLYDVYFERRMPFRSMLYLLEGKKRIFGPVMGFSLFRDNAIGDKI